MLSKIISEIPSESAELEMLQRFEKLLKKYAKLLSYEDAYNDLVVFFLELLLSDSVKKLEGKQDAIRGENIGRQKYSRFNQSWYYVLRVGFRIIER